VLGVVLGSPGVVAVGVLVWAVAGSIPGRSAGLLTFCHVPNFDPVRAGAHVAIRMHETAVNAGAIVPPAQWVPASGA
jgi:hypothetical protein